MNFNTQFKKLAHGLSLLFSIIMAIMLLVTISLMADLYRKYCGYVKDHPTNDPYELPAVCGKHQRQFMILPLFGYFTMIVWVRSNEV